MADTQGLIGRGTLPGERPYQTKDESTKRMQALSSMGGGRKRMGGPVDVSGGQEPPPTAEGTTAGPPMRFSPGAPPKPQTIQDFGPQALEESRKRFIAQNSPLEDPLSVLAPVQGALEGIGNLIVGGLADPRAKKAWQYAEDMVPGLHGAALAMQAAGPALGVAMEAPLGAEALGADVAGMLTGQGQSTGEFGRAYLRGSNQPDDNPFVAVLHGFQAVEQQRSKDMGQVVGDPKKPVDERFRAAVGGGLAMLIEQALIGPEFAVGEAVAGGIIRAAARGTGSALLAAERSIGRVAPGAGAFESRQAERVVAERKLPEELSRAKPRFGRTEVTFESDVDKALYIVRDPEIKSARDTEYMKYLKEQFPNASDGEIRVMGKQVRDELRKLKAVKGEYEYTRTLPKTEMAKNADVAAGEGVAAASERPSEVDQWRTYQGPPVMAKFSDGKRTRIKAGTMGYIVSEDASGQTWRFETTTGRAEAKIKPTGDVAPEGVDPIEAKAQAASKDRAAAEADLQKATSDYERVRRGETVETPAAAPKAGRKSVARAAAPAAAPKGETVEYGTKTGRASGTLVGKNEDGHYIIDVGGGKTIVRRRIHHIRDEATKEIDESEVISSIMESEHPSKAMGPLGRRIVARSSEQKAAEAGVTTPAQTKMIDATEQAILDHTAERDRPPGKPPSKPPAPPTGGTPPEPPSRRATPLVAERTRMSAEDAARFSETVPLSERNAIIDEITEGRINSSRLTDDMAANFAEAMTREPEKFSHFTERVSDPELIQRAANHLGLTTEQMSTRLTQMGFGKPGEMAAVLYASEIRTVQLIDDFVRANAVSEEAGGAAYTDLVKFSTQVAGANSEVGRTLRMMQLQRQLSLTGALKAREGYAVADRVVREAEKQGEKAAKKVAQAVARGDFDMVKVAEKNRSAWENKVEKARAERESAKSNLIDAGKRAKSLAFKKVNQEIADAHNLKDAKELNSIAIAIAKSDPSDPVAIAQLIGKTQKWTPAQKYITAVMSGAYSGPLGHVRSAVGAGMNLADEVVTSGIASTLNLPGFSKEHFSDRLFGLMEANRTYWGDGITKGMLHNYLIERVSPEMTAGAKGLEDVSGPVFTGALRPLGFSLEMHGLYHSTGFHYIFKTELATLLKTRARAIAGKSATNEAIADAYVTLVKDPPSGLVDQAVKVATDRRYLAEQGKVFEAMLKVVSAEFGPGPLKAAWLRPYFVAARFGIGFAGRQIEFGLGGGLARAANIAFRDIPNLENEAIKTEAKLRALKELNTELGGKEPTQMQFAERAQQILARKDPELKKAALRSIDTERDFLMREASKAGVRGFVGASLFGVGYLASASGKIHRDGFETWADTPFGPMNLTWLMPYSAPFVFSSILYAAKSKGELTKPEDEEAAVIGAIRALSQNIVEGDSLAQIATLDDVLNGRANRVAYRQLGQLAARLAVPGFSVAAREADRILDNGAKDPRSWDEYLRYYMPLARRALRPQLDPTTGEEMPDQPQGAARLNPAAVQTRPPTSPIADQDKQFQQSDPTYKGLTKATKSWGTKDDKVELTEDQQWEYERREGVARKSILGALLNDTAFKNADPKEQRKMWAAADVVARRETRRDYAVELMRTGDAANMNKYAKAAYDANGDGRAEVSLWLLQLKNERELTPAVEAALGKVIQEHEAPTKSKYTIQSYERVMQAVSDYLHLAPFTTGDPGDWKQYKDQKKEYDALYRQDAVQAFRFYQAHPLLGKYDRAVNVQRTIFLSRHPEIEPFISGQGYTWIR